MSASSDYLNVLTSITREGGATRAATARANAQIWGGTVAKLGDFASDAIKQYAVDKKAKKEEERDQAFRDLFTRASQEFEAQQQPSMAELTQAPAQTQAPYQQGDLSALPLRPSSAPTMPNFQPSDPRIGGPTLDTSRLPQGPELKQARTPRSSPFPTPSEILNAVGPERGMPVINGIAALQKLSPNDDTEKRKSRLLAVWRGLDRLPKDQRAAAFPGIVQVISQAYGMDPSTVPAYDESTWDTLGAALGEKPSTAKPDYTIGNQRVSGDTNQVLFTGTGTTDKLPTSVEALRTIAANSKDPRQAEAQGILDSLPESVRITGPEMDERYRKIMAKPGKTRTPDEVAWSGAYERQKAVSQPAVVIQTDQGPAVVDRRSRTAEPITTPGGQPVMAPPTQPQALDATFAKRLDDAGTVIDNVSDKITKMSLADFEVQKRLPAAMQSDTMQQYDQASRNLINTILRRESGAAISTGEFADARRQYLPVPGDGAAVLKQKAQNRQRQREGFIKGAGPVYTPDVSADKVRVKGPNGERGTMPKTSALPPGWSLER